MEGRLTVEEVEERIQAALTAKTRADLAVLFEDLPGDLPVEDPAPTQLAEAAPLPATTPQSTYSSANWMIPALLLFVMLPAGRVIWPLMIALLIWGIFAVANHLRSKSVPAATQPRPITAEQRLRVERELMAGHKIQAIKLYREFTGADLLTAKTAVDSYQRQLPGA